MEPSWTDVLHIVHGQLMGVERAHDMHALLGARDGDVQAVLASGRAESTELPAEHTVGALGVPDAEDDDVTLVTLNVLDVLDDRTLVLVRVLLGHKKQLSE